MDFLQDPSIVTKLHPVTLPEYGITEEEVLESLLSKHIYLGAPLRGEGHLHLLRHQSDVVQCGLNWMIKRHLDSKHKFHTAKDLRQSTEQLGNWFGTIRALCIDIQDHLEHASIKGNAEPPRYQSAFQLFHAILHSFQTAGLVQSQMALYPNAIQNKATKSSKGRKKDTILSWMGQVCSLVNGGEPPILEAQETSFGYFITNTLAICDAPGAESLKNRKFKPFIKAWRASIKEVDTHYGISYLNDDNDVVMPTGGNRVRNLSALIRYKEK